MTTRRRTPRGFALFCLSLALPFALGLAAVQPAEAGYRYTAETTTSGDAGDSTLQVEAWVDGENAKVLFVESDQPMMEQGSYMLTNDGGRTLLLVDPQEKSYTRIDISSLFQSLNALMESTGGMVDLEFSDVSVERVSEQPGEEILGYPTTHTRFDTSYTTRIKVMGMKQESQSQADQEIWTTDALDDAAFGVFLRKEPIATGDESFDRLVAAEMSKLEGFPLRSVVTTTTSSGRKGKRQSTVRTETRVTSIEETDVAASTFALPEGYEEVELTDDSARNPLSGLFGDNR